MDLTVGPNPYFWSAASVQAFYAMLAAAPVARVVVGEWVCSKRLPFWQGEIPQVVEALQEGGKEVALSTLALITLTRERKQAEEIFALGLPVEINDISALKHLPEGTSFWVGPMVNVYNEGTLEWLGRKGARRICLPPELPLASIRTLARVAGAIGVTVEVWGHGRVPLAISSRCYHARMNGFSKDSCQFACADDPAGREVDTLDGQRFVVVNGVQTLGASVASAAADIEALKEAGVGALRLSPAPDGFDQLCDAYAALLAGRMGREQMIESLSAIEAGRRLSNGFLHGAAGASWIA